MTTPNTLHSIDAHANFHKALAEPIRLRILALLHNQPSLCVCDLVTILELSQSTVSRHLSYLKNQQIVYAWREGTWIHYAINRQHPSLALLSDSVNRLTTLACIQADLTQLQQYQALPRQCNL